MLRSGPFCLTLCLVLGPLSSEINDQDWDTKPSLDSVFIYLGGYLDLLQVWYITEDKLITGVTLESTNITS